MDQTVVEGAPLTDIETLRRRAKANLESGAVTDSYVGDAARMIGILQGVLATELVCALRYLQHSIVATGLASESVKAEFAEHAKEEQRHAMVIAERINQLGGAPDFNPASLADRSAAQYETADDLATLIRRESRGRADRHRSLPRAHPARRRQRSGDASDAGVHPHGRGGTRQRHAGPPVRSHKFLRPAAAVDRLPCWSSELERPAPGFRPGPLRGGAGSGRPFTAPQHSRTASPLGQRGAWGLRRPAEGGPGGRPSSPARRTIWPASSPSPDRDAPSP